MTAEETSFQSEVREKESPQQSHDEDESHRTSRLSERRQNALQAYTDYFGGSPEQNAEELQDLPISEIYEEIREHRRINKGIGSENGS